MPKAKQPEKDLYEAVVILPIRHRSKVTRIYFLQLTKCIAGSGFMS